MAPVLSTLSDSLFRRVLCHASPDDILNLGATSRYFHIFTASYFKEAMDIDAHLAPFFATIPEIKRFRNALLVADAFISGSFALQFFDRQFWDRLGSGYLRHSRVCTSPHRDHRPSRL
ncbi:hypothetical protein C8J56DRAFT_1041982 [Mycena floridula]|nr:hypothetical protein C8J56DRAFT_1041982 [Mycena floridula]